MNARGNRRSATSLLIGAACAIAVLMGGCRDTTAPTEGRLSGVWVQSYIDTYARLALEQHEAEVTGTMVYGGVVVPPVSYPVKGIVLGRQAVLSWTRPDGRITFKVTVPGPDANELSGEMSLNGDAPGPPETFMRATVAFATEQKR